MLPFYTRWLSVADYGTTDIITVYATLLTGISTLSVAEAMFIFPKGASYKDQQRYFSSAIAFTAVLLSAVAIIFALVAYCGDKHLDGNVFITYIWFIYGIIFSTFLQSITQQFACAIDALKIYSFTGFVYVISLAVSSVCLIPKYGVRGYVYSMILSNLLASSYTFLCSKSYRYISLRSISLSSYKSMIRYSVPLIPNSLMFWLVSSFNRPFMESYVGVAGIGLFAIANKFASVLSMIFQYFGTSWQISVSEEYGRDGFVLFFNRVLRLFFLLLVILAMLIAIFSHELMVLFSTPEYYAASVYIAPLCLAVVFNCMAGLTGVIFAVSKNSKYFFYTSVLGAVTSLIVNLVAIPQIGVWGAVISVIISFLVMWISRVLYARKYVTLSQFGFYFLVIAAYVLLAFFTYVCHNLFLKIFIFILFILSCLCKKEIRKSVSSFFKKIISK